MKRVILTLAALALLLGSTGQAKAGTITSLFNTGVNAVGTPLSDDTIGDPHYTLTVVPVGSSTDIRVRRAIGGFPIPPYFGDNSLSAWIGPNNDHTLTGPGGLYTYRTTFDLTSFDPATASITGGWSSDNNGVQILLNGGDTGNPGTNFSQFSLGFASFSITSGFQPGVNTLDFIVNNGDGPTALRVEMTGTASAVPEPATMTLLGIGLAGLAGYGIRRRKQQTTNA